MATVTLTSMIDAALERAGMTNSGFIPRPVAVATVNGQLGELFDLLISRPTNPFTAKLEFTISSGNEYALASDFLNFRALDYQCGAEWTEVVRASFRQRNRSAARMHARTRLFDLIGSKLYITPAENALGTYRLWYDPQFVPLAESSPTPTSIDLPNQWAEFAICGATAIFLTEEESDPSVWLALKAKAEERILAATTERDRGAPRAIVDVRGGCDDDEDY